ncbi:MAG: RNA polymerase factor sigma-54 [Rhodoferax sp.]
MKQGLALRVSQHLTLTPQLQQSIRLLQLSTLELEQEVDQMLADNPFLDVDSEFSERESLGLEHADAPVSEGDRILEATLYAAGSGADAAATDPETDDGLADAPLDWDGDASVSFGPDDAEWGGEASLRGAQADDDSVEATELAHSQPGLQAHLQQQAHALRLMPEEAAALQFLIGSLDEDGYLQDDLTALAQLLTQGTDDDPEQVLHHLTVALRLLQSMDPPGVGARNLAECLRLQLDALAERALRQGRPDLDLIALARRMCAQPLELLARRDVRQLGALCRAPEAAVRQALALITRLEPKPGRRFADVQRNLIVPDVLVQRVGTPPLVRFQVRLNPEVMPRLRVHDVYANALRGVRGAADASAMGALQQRLQEARWFIKNIQQRFDTILRVSQAIVERQKSFFVHGELAMRPLVLREIADELGLHESTISRVTTAKYMATPQGTFELKYFFGSGLGTESGGNASSTAVRALIKQFIAAESPAKPLSDSQIAEMLKEQGIECARRTVAKYREGLRIPPTSLRKAI